MTRFTKAVVLSATITSLLCLGVGAPSATAASGDPTTVTVTVMKSGGPSAGTMSSRTYDPVTWGMPGVETPAGVIGPDCTPTATGCLTTVGHTPSVTLSASNRKADF